MNSRERMNAAMRLDTLPPDRVPVMCQLSLGHYFLNTNIPAVDIWHDSSAFAEALVMLQKRYEFDGILVNLPGRDPNWREHIESIDRNVIRWKEGARTIVPPDDNPRVERAGRAEARRSTIYIEPHDRLGVTAIDAFPPWQFDTLRRVRALAPGVSVHGEVFSPFSQLIELLGIEDAMMLLIDDPDRVKSMLSQFVEGAAQLGRGLVEAGADAVLISSAYAGAGFISGKHYEEFVLPYERAVIERIKPAIVYTHTCGAIGDRLDLLEATGTNGIDTLDPPPLGTVDLADARRRLSPRVFIKGNIDPVNTVLRGTPDDCYRAAMERVAVAGPRQYVLSTACSVPPRAPAENILAIARAAKESTCVA